MLARRVFLLASLLAATTLPGVAQAPAPAPAEMAKPKSAPAPAAAPAPAPAAVPTDRAGLRRSCAERSEAMGLRGKTKLRWQVKCRKGKLAN